MSMVAMLRDHCALEREHMPRRSSDVFGEIEAYADLLSGRDRKGHRVTEHRRSRRDRGRIATVKRDSLNRVWSDARGVVRHSHRYRSDHEGGGAVFVGKAN